MAVQNIQSMRIYSVSRDIPEQISNQEENCSPKYSGSRNIPAQTFLQQGFCSVQLSASRGNPVQYMQSAGKFQYSIFIFSREVPAHNIQSAGQFEYKIFSRQGSSSSKYSVSKAVRVQKTKFRRQGNASPKICRQYAPALVGGRPSSEVKALCKARNFLVFTGIVKDVYGIGGAPHG
jgi:hypothetical protein